MKSRVIMSLALLFVASFAVRFVLWQNNKTEMATVQWAVTASYLSDARVLAAGDIRTFLAGPDPPSNARIIDHPPGYPLIIGLTYSLLGEGDAWRIIQLALNSLAPVLLFLIAAAVFDDRVGMIAGVLAAVSPQLAYHSGLMLPDELCVVPVLAAVYFLVRAMREPGVSNAALCGLFLGLSCWLRSNALILPVFFAIGGFCLVERSMRARFAALMLAAFVVTIAPITIRNAVCFRSFIPLSLGGGTTFVEGLGDIDGDSRRLPRLDEEVMQLDSKLDRSDAPYPTLYDPDGVERDRRRLSFGLSVVRSDPLWFARGVAARGLSTFRLERVPAIAPERDERSTTNAFLYAVDRPLKFMQQAFITAVFLPLVLLGLVALIARRRWRELGVLLIVPLYYATVQPLIHTEYRYVLATPHMLMIVAATAMCWSFGKLVALRRDRERAGSA